MSRSSLTPAVFTLLLVGLLALILQQNAIPAHAKTGWEALLNTSPIAYNQPLPPPASSPLDGTYAKLDPAWPQWWKCLRCADYRDAGGLWKIQFDRGVMRIYYDVTGWYSLASFTVSGDRLTLFNDPFCPNETGEYSWQLTGGTLQLTPRGDTCAFQLRQTALTKQPWHACTPNADHPGCTEFIPPAKARPPRGLTVLAYPGDSRFFETPPDLSVLANTSEFPAPEGITLRFHPASISYGVNRILWWDGPWIEMTTDLPFAAMGVQFLGEPPMGWARVLFDGVEVWNGKTADLGFQKYRHGGYLEISGFAPGPHTLRVESLILDYHPVTIASFGFSEQTVVQP
ncbi:MAG: hypothetical protein Fur0022_20440 [Anaerolineales bacterium]